MLEDKFGSVSELTIWPTQYKALKSFLIDGIPIRCICNVNEYLDVKSLTLKNIEEIPGFIKHGKILKVENEEE